MIRSLRSRPRLILLLALALSIHACASAPDRTPAPAPIVVTPLRLTPAPVSTSSPTPFHLERHSGNARTRIDRLLEEMPQPGSNAYVVPKDSERAAFSTLVKTLLNGDPAQAAALASTFGYSIIDYSDRGDKKAQEYLLEEQTPIQRGWGWYAFRKDASSNVIIEAPHPLADANTTNVALDLYRVIDARALLIAGAHRSANDDGSADVSHTPGSLFQVIHNSLVDEPLPVADALIVLQIHGFDSARHPTYPDIVIGYDRAVPKPLAARINVLREALVSAGFQVGVCDGKSWEALCGTTDVMRSIPHGLVIHLELNESVRAHDRDLVRALEQVFAASVP
jgi:hypothetical protein